MKAKMDLAFYCDYQNIKSFNDGLCVTKPKATFTIDNDT
jgi:hypothetical protein